MGGQYDLDELYANTYTEEDRLAFENQPTSEKSFLTAWVLALLLGPIGAHRCYLGHLPTAVLKTVLFGGGVALLGLELSIPGLALVGVAAAWMIIDLFLLLSGTMRDKAGHRLHGFTKYAGFCAAVTVLALVLLLFVALVAGTSSRVSL